MMKEVALFTVSSSVLFYFLTPVSEDPEAIPEEIVEREAQSPAPQQTVDDSWDYEDEEDTEEEFVFGEPLVGDNDEDYAEEGDQRAEDIVEIAQTSNNESNLSKAAQTAKSENAHPDSPQGSERGSRENPIVFETNNPVDPVDD